MSILLEKEYDKKNFDMDLKSKLEQMCRNCIALDISGKGEYKLGEHALVVSLMSHLILNGLTMKGRCIRLVLKIALFLF